MMTCSSATNINFENKKKQDNLTHQAVVEALKHVALTNAKKG
jgi:hypothetical protein